MEGKGECGVACCTLPTCCEGWALTNNQKVWGNRDVQGGGRKENKLTTRNGCISLRCVQSEFKRGIGLELTRCALCIRALISPYFQVVGSHYKCWLHDNASVTPVRREWKNYAPAHQSSDYNYTGPRPHSSPCRVWFHSSVPPDMYYHSPLPRWVWAKQGWRADM